MKYSGTYRETFERDLVVEASSEEEALDLLCVYGKEQAAGEAFLVEQEILDESIQELTDKEAEALRECGAFVVNKDMEDAC